MKQNIVRRKLVIHRETLRVLSSHQLDRVAGGDDSGSTYPPTCTSILSVCEECEPRPTPTLPPGFVE